MSNLNLNGKIIQKKGHLDELYRLIAFGDGFFETIKVNKGKLPFWDAHYIRIQRAFRILKFGPLIPQDLILTEVQKLLYAQGKNTGRLKIIFYNKGQGTYAREEQNIGFFLFFTPMENVEFLIDSSPYEFDVYSSERKSKGELASLKTTNSLLYTLATQEALEKNLQDNLILDYEGNIIEATCSNIFLLSHDGSIISPPLDSGCVQGTMATIISDILKKENFKLLYLKVSIDDILAAKEIWFTNAIAGLKCGTQFRDQNFDSKEGNKIQLLLNERFMKT